MSALLRTKLLVPPVRHDLVSRHRLLERLDTGLWSAKDRQRETFGRKLTLISAPAGFGKTTLAAEWITGSEGTQAGWLSLDGADSDPTRFLAYVVGALQNVVPDIGQESQVVLQAGALPALDDALVLLVNDIAAAAHPLMLVLDDYHAIHAEAVDRLVVTLLERQPPNFHLVIASRADPSLPLSRLRAQRQMLELRAFDLRFADAEVAAFLNQTMGLDLSTEAIAALEQRTEGWIAGLQLAALSMQGRDDAEAFIRAFSGSNRYIIDYLVDEVLRSQPPEVRSFLVQTSVLDYLCAPLCDAVMGYSAPAAVRDRAPHTSWTGEATAAPGQEASALSQGLLDYLERTNLFLLPMDDQREWYRYHQLFADSLQTELAPEQEPELHRRAARWYAENGYPARAVQHALAALDHDYAAELLGASGREAVLWAGGDFRQYRDWVEMLPKEIRQKHPRLQVVYARALQITGQLRRAEELLVGIVSALQAAPVVDDELLSMAKLYQSQCLLERGEIGCAFELVTYAVDHLSESTPLNRVRAQSGLACIEYGLGDFARATPRFLQISTSPESPSLALNAMECAARGLLLQGQLRAAQQVSEQMLVTTRTKTTYNHLAAGAFGTLAEVHYYQDVLDGIVAHGEQAVELARRMAPEAPLRAHEVWVYLQLARLYQVRGNEAGVAEALALADSVAHDIENAFYLELIQVREAAFRLGREHGIVALQKVRPYPAVAFAYLEEYRRWTEVQVLLRRHRPQDALSILDNLVERAQRDGRGLSVIELHLWRTLALHALKQMPAASAALTQALVLAAPEACLRIFLDTGPALATLLPLVRSAAPDFVDRLTVAFSDKGHSPKALEDPAPQRSRVDASKNPLLQFERLSEREIEILQLVAEGLSNQEIGRKLFIGVGTVKWYLTNLYGKLDVANRTQAVARARDLGIVP